MCGEIWWTQPIPIFNQRTVATNASATIIAARLSQAYKTIDPTKSDAYLEKALLIYNLTQTNLYKGNGYLSD